MADVPRNHLQPGAFGTIILRGWPKRYFCIWRQSLDRQQSIFALHNVSEKEIKIPHPSMNLIDGETWVDFLSGEDIDMSQDAIVMAPYQCRWTTNLA